MRKRCVLKLKQTKHLRRLPRKSLDKRSHRYQKVRLFPRRCWTNSTAVQLRNVRWPWEFCLVSVGKGRFSSLPGRSTTLLLRYVTRRRVPCTTYKWIEPLHSREPCAKQRRNV